LTTAVADSGGHEPSRTLWALKSLVPDYYYELRRGDVVEATGRVSREEPFEVGENVVIGRRHGVVRAIYPKPDERAFRVVVQLTPD
jgi:hypothetical protein